VGNPQNKAAIRAFKAGPSCTKRPLSSFKLMLPESSEGGTNSRSHRRLQPLKDVELFNLWNLASRRHQQRKALAIVMSLACDDITAIEHTAALVDKRSVVNCNAILAIDLLYFDHTSKLELSVFFLA